MSIQQMLTTVLGGFFFALFLQLIWDRLVDKLGGAGGLIAAMLIPGTMWIINHGLPNKLVLQTGSVWIDMSWAAAIGGIVVTKKSGNSILKSLPNIVAAIIGGVLAGGFIYFL